MQAVLGTRNDQVAQMNLRQKVLLVIGTRPEAIKMAPVVHALAAKPERFLVRVCVTAQHRQMLDQVLRLFEIKPDHDLNVMRPGQSLTAVTAAVLRGMEEVLRTENPDWVLVQGDTTTVMATSLAAFYQRTRVGHVEAGLRTGDIGQPFPEEMNRRVCSVMADVHYAPTQQAAANLRAEGVPSSRIVVTGNTVIDALRQVSAMPFDWSQFSCGGASAGWEGKQLVLVTAHRRENFGPPLERICEAIREIARHRTGSVHFVYPVHLNPNVQEPVGRLLGMLPNITLLPPLEYLQLVHLLKRSYLVLTDSGGLQEEAPGLGKPVLVLREVTERPEGVAAGTVKLVGTDPDRIVREVSLLLDDPAEHRRMSEATNPYGDGFAAARIADHLDGHAI